jgi:flavorubredoxin
MRCRSWNRLRFEIEYARERGTTANSYLIQGDRTALIDPPGESFSEMFLIALERAHRPVPAEFHCAGAHQPQPGGDPEDLLQRLPEVTVVCSNPAALALKDLLPDASPRVRVVRSGDDSLDLGQGHVLQFGPIPTPRYPGGLATFDPYAQILYSDKFFGAHLCGDACLTCGWDDLLEDRRYYFDCLFAASTRQTMAALDRMEAFPYPHAGPWAWAGDAVQRQGTGPQLSPVGTGPEVPGSFRGADLCLGLWQHRHHCPGPGPGHHQSRGGGGSH